MEDGPSIRIFSAPYFLATKLEAFVDRGENEGRFSSDFEDIVHVLNNRQPIWEEMKNADEPIKQYLKSEFAKLLDQKYIDECLQNGAREYFIKPSDMQQFDKMIDHLSTFVDMVN